MSKNREIIDTFDGDGKSIKLAILRPGHRVMQDAIMKYNLKVSTLIRQASKNGERLLLRSEVEDHLVKTGIWTNDDVLKIERLSIAIRTKELLLQRGGIKLSEARSLAIEMSEHRAGIMVLYNKKQQLDNATVEAVAENYKFGFLMIHCVVDPDSGESFFASYDDYLERGDELAVVDSAKALAGFIYGVQGDLSMNLYENKWLKDNSFIDSSGKLLNSNGDFVDKDGKAVDKDGKYVDGDGNFVDRSGNRVDEAGSFLMKESKPFLDEDGNPIVEKKSVVPKKRKKTTKKRKTVSKV